MNFHKLFLSKLVSRLLHEGCIDYHLESEANKRVVVTFIFGLAFSELSIPGRNPKDGILELMEHLMHESLQLSPFDIPEVLDQCLERLGSAAEDSCDGTYCRVFEMGQNCLWHCFEGREAEYSYNLRCLLNQSLSA